MALKLAEVGEIGGQAVAFLADHRHFDHHSKGRDPGGSAGKCAKLSPMVIPVRKHIVSAYDDADGTLLEKLVDRYGRSKCFAAHGTPTTTSTNNGQR